MTVNLSSSLNQVFLGLGIVIIIAIVASTSNKTSAQISELNSAGTDLLKKSQMNRVNGLILEQNDLTVLSLPPLDTTDPIEDQFQSLHPNETIRVQHKRPAQEELGIEFQSAYKHLAVDQGRTNFSVQTDSLVSENVPPAITQDFDWRSLERKAPIGFNPDRDFVPQPPQLKSTNYNSLAEAIVPHEPINGSSLPETLDLQPPIDSSTAFGFENRSSDEFHFEMSSIDDDVLLGGKLSLDQQSNNDDFGDGNSGLVPDNPLTWWRQRAIEPLNMQNQTLQIDIHSLVYLALKNSPRIQAISQNPMISELQVIESETEFDPIRFVESNYNDRNDPVGNTLITGGPPFLRDNIWDANAGVRKLTRTGANVELSQRLGFQNSNSNFFVPQDQGTATLALNVSQPLLRGRGRYINQTQILIAQAAGMVAWDAFAEELQVEVERLLQGYWRLYYQRSIFLQKQKNVQRGQQILTLLEGRSELDTLPSQMSRARSAIENRRTELANAYRDVRNAETEIRRLIADRDWLASQNIELIPAEIPRQETFDVPLESVVQTALENRPEVKQVLQQARINNIRLDIANNQVLPDLTFLIGGYVSALNGNSGVLNSLADQFGNGPGYNVGLAYEMPYGNRAARSRLAQQKLQIAKVKAEVNEAMQQVIADSQIALRRIESAVQTRIASQTAIAAATDDLQHQQSRWEAFGLIEGDMLEGQNATLLLNQVLDAQERLAAAELIFAQSELELKVAEIGLQRAMGTLLIHQKIDSQMTSSHDNPRMVLEKQ